MVFVKRKADKKVEDYPIFSLLNKKEKTGEVGLEIELESETANVFPKNPETLGKPASNYWNYVKDGSLRGADNAEYVLQEPIAFSKADEAVDALFTVLKKIPLAESNRTSVHVHVNVLPFYVNRVASLMALWFTVEEVLSHFCGEHRVGNLFALRAKDAPMIVRRCAEFAKTSQISFSEGSHYAAMSPYAIMKHGSLEFRTLRGVTDPELMKTWVKIVKCLYDASERFKDPTDIPLGFSYNGPMDFFRELFGSDLAQAIQDGSGLTDEQIRDSLYEGVRYAQEVCYARDWSVFNPVKVVQDPFGRKTTKAKTFAATMAAVQEANAQHFDWNEMPQVIPRPRAARPAAMLRNNPFAEDNI